LYFIQAVSSVVNGWVHISVGKNRKAGSTFILTATTNR